MKNIFESWPMLSVALWLIAAARAGICAFDGVNITVNSAIISCWSINQLNCLFSALFIYFRYRINDFSLILQAMVSRVTQSVARNGRRFLSTAPEGTSKTQILIVHEGFPKSEFYARKALSKEAKNYYNWPKAIDWWVLLLFVFIQYVCLLICRQLPSFLIPEKVGKCMEDYGKFGDVQVSI